MAKCDEQGNEVVVMEEYVELLEVEMDIPLDVVWKMKKMVGVEVNCLYKMVVVPVTEAV